MADQDEPSVDEIPNAAPLHDSEFPFRDFADAAAVIMWVTDPRGYCTYLNRAWYDYTGQTKAEAEGFGWIDATHPDDKAEVKRIFLEANAEQKSFRTEYRLRRYDGIYRWAIDAASPRFDSQNGFAGFVGSVIDIHERREMEDRLRDSEARFRQFNEHSSDVIWIRDAATMQFEYVSPAIEAIYGVTPTEFSTRHNDLKAWAEIVHPDDRASALDAFRHVRSGERVTHEFRIERPDGEVRWIRDTDFPMTDEHGQVQRVAGIGQDVTEEKRAQSALLEREERLTIIVRNARDYAIFTTDIEGIVTDWREGAEAVFGWSSDEAIGMDIRRIYTSEDQKAGVADAEMQVAHEIGRAPDVRWHVHKDGSRVFIDGSVFRLGEGVTTGFLKIGQDVTERHQAANALRASEGRLGIMVAELQHRTRNLLGVVNATMSSTIRDANGLDDFAQQFRQRLNALARVNSLLSTQKEGERIAFDELIRMELAGVGAFDPAAENRHVELGGPDGVKLRSGTIQTLALAIHELATNAVKYGALSQPSGHLSIRWKLLQDEEGHRLHVTWLETGVVMPEQGIPSQGSGYGRELIKRALPYQLHARTDYTMQADGICCTIDMPIVIQEFQHGE